MAPASLQLAGREADTSRHLPQVVVSVAPAASPTLPVPAAVLQASVCTTHPVEAAVEVAGVLMAQGNTVTVIYTAYRQGGIGG